MFEFSVFSLLHPIAVGPIDNEKTITEMHQNRLPL